MDLKEAVKNLPRQPGIYLMKNTYGMVIYVGKAKDLKARVSQYFQSNKNHSPRVVEMIQQIDTFDTVTVDTELEAFLMEGETIRELRPPYNKLLKNYLNYKYIKLDINKNYPIPEIVTQSGTDKSLYFGPFTSQSSLENALLFIKDHFKIRKCNTRTVKSSPSGCLNLQLGNCSGPCTGKDVLAQYNDQIQIIIHLLQGKDQEPVRLLKQKMLSSAEKLEFEKAAALREQLKGIRHVLYKQKIIKISSCGRNIIAAERYGDNTLKLFFIKGNRLLQKETILISEHMEDMLEETIKRLSANCFKSYRNMDRTLSQEDIDEAHIIYSYLKKRKNGIFSSNVPSSRLETLNYRRIAQLILKNNEKEEGIK